MPSVPRDNTPTTPNGHQSETWPALQSDVVKKLQDLSDDLAKLDAKFGLAEARLCGAKARIDRDRQTAEGVQAKASREAERFHQLFANGTEAELVSQSQPFTADLEEFKNSRQEQALPETPPSRTPLLSVPEGESLASRLQSVEGTWALTNIANLHTQLWETSQRIDSVSNTCVEEIGRLSAELAQISSMLQQEPSKTSSSASLNSATPLVQNEACVQRTQDGMDRDRWMNELLSVGTIATLIGGFALTIIPEVPTYADAKAIGQGYNELRLVMSSLFFVACHTTTFAALASAVLYSAMNRCSDEEALAFARMHKYWLLSPDKFLGLGTVCYIGGVVMFLLFEHDKDPDWYQLLLIGVGMCCLSMIAALIITVGKTKHTSPNSGV